MEILANFVVFGLLTILHKNTILLPSGWVRIKLLPRVMEKILISCDGKKILTLVAFGHAGKNFLTIT